MNVQKNLSSSFKIEVQSRFLPEHSSPSENRFVYAYHIKIQNKGQIGAQLLARFWMISNALGKTEEVQGSGVVGLQPKIGPGGTFEYESLCPLDTPTGSQRGWYEFMSEDGHRFLVEIPEFFHLHKSALH